MDGGTGVRFTTIDALRRIAMQACSGSACEEGGCCCRDAEVTRAFEASHLIDVSAIREHARHHGYTYTHPTLILQRVLEPPLLLRGNRVSSRDFVITVHWRTDAGNVELAWLVPGWLLRATSSDPYATSRNSYAASSHEWARHVTRAALRHRHRLLLISCSPPSPPISSSPSFLPPPGHLPLHAAEAALPARPP